MNKQTLLANLPSVDEILKSGSSVPWLQMYMRPQVTRAIREAIQALRESILSGKATDFDIAALEEDIAARLEQLAAFSLKKVINATGVVLHTNLGRAVLSPEILERVVEVASGYSNLEFDLESGSRGKRHAHIRKLLAELTGAEDALIVNNNAAAVMVCLSALAKDRKVIVSRGELVEIGGSFRIPDVMAAGGAILREVGTTNKTHCFDFEKAVSDDSALMLKVHQSNFRMVGFTSEVNLDEMVELGRKLSLPVMYDLGSGSLLDLKPYGIHIEPSVKEIVKSGVDIVTFSGDKLLGGPQAGLIVGTKKLIDKIEKNPLMRAVRIDKMTLAAFEATLRYYLDDEIARKKIPTLSMLLQGSAKIKERAEDIATHLRKRLGNGLCSVDVIEDSSQSGGGALSGITLETFVVALSPLTISVNELEKRLRLSKTPVVARIKEGQLLLDARTIQNNESEQLVATVAEALSS